MSCRNVVADNHTYRFCPDDPIRGADFMQAVVRGRFIDELTNQALVADLNVSTEVDGLFPRVSVGGLAGLVGNPGRLFPELEDPLGTIDLDMTVAAGRYLTRRFADTRGPMPSFPNAFETWDLGNVPMHREAVRLRGRAVRTNTSPPAALAGVTIRIDGMWSVFPAADVDAAAVIEVPNIAALSPGLYADRSAGGDALRRRNMTLAAGEEKQIELPVVAGDTSIVLSDRVNLNVGNILAIQPSQTDIAEYIEVTGIEARLTDDQPAVISLRYPVAHGHREGSQAVRATPELIGGTNNNLLRAGIPFDRVAFLDGLVDLAGVSTVEIAGTGSPEYQSVALYQTVSDAEGYFRLPPISRVAQILLHAERADLLPQVVDMVVSPNYDHFEDRRDIVFA